MDADAAANKLPLLPLLVRRIHKPRKSHRGN
jgi:hypothetical protein